MEAISGNNMRHGLTLARVLEDEALRTRFAAFLQGEFSSENLEFYLACQHVCACGRPGPTPESCGCGRGRSGSLGAGLAHGPGLLPWPWPQL